MKDLVIALVALLSISLYGCSKERPTVQEIFREIAIGSSNDAVAFILHNELKSKNYNLTGESLIGPLGHITHQYKDSHGNEVEIKSESGLVFYIKHTVAAP